MLNTLTFSVVIPLYNKENYIGATIQSVLGQDYPHFEIIIVNDGSTDKSVFKVKEFNDKRISLIHQKNKGLSSSRNTGINVAKYNYIAFLDADDLWRIDYLSTIYKLIEHYKEGKIFSTKASVLWPKQTANLTVKCFSLNNVDLIENYFIHKKNIPSNSSIVVHKTVFENIGYYDTTINYGEEEDFFIRCFSEYNLIHYNESKVYYLKGLDNQLTSPYNKIERIIPDYSKYLTKENYKTLKPYIDFIYFKLIVLYKMERNRKLVEHYKSKIEVTNLNFIRKIKYFMPTTLFYYSKNIYLKLLKVFSHS